MCETRSQLRILLDLEVVPRACDSFRHLTTFEKPIDIDVGEYRQESEFHLEEAEPSVEEQNNAEDSSIPTTHLCLEVNAISTADQAAAVPCSVQPNDIEAQKALENIIKDSSVQESFERKLSKTWKQECTTYDDLNKNIPILSPHGDQSQNFASSGFVKTILAPYRKKITMTLDVGSIANCENLCMDEPNVNVNSLERQYKDYSSSEEEMGAVKDCCKGKAISDEQQHEGENLLYTSYHVYTSLVPRSFPSLQYFMQKQQKSTCTCSWKGERGQGYRYTEYEACAHTHWKQYAKLLCTHNAELKVPMTRPHCVDKGGNVRLVHGHMCNVWVRKMFTLLHVYQILPNSAGTSSV